MSLIVKEKELPKILINFSNHIQEVESYIKSSFRDIEAETLLKQEEYEKIKDLTTIYMNDCNFPLELDLDHNFKIFFDSGVLKPFEKKSIEDHFKSIFFTKELKRMCYILFCMVFILKFPENIKDENMSILLNFRKEFSQLYIFLLSESRSKDELINILIFSICYITHMTYYLLFPKNHKNFKIRFVLDVYHIALFELNGVYISDYYLQNNFERIFTSKFLEYEHQTNNPLIIKKKQPILIKNEKTFLGKKLIYPILYNHEGGVDFAEDLSVSLKTNKKSPRRHGLFVNSKPKLDQIEESKVEFENKDKIKEEKIITKTRKNSDIIDQKIEKINEKTLLNSNFAKKFNCTQISPTVSSVLEINNMNLPFNRKKIINHSIDKMYTQNKDYKEIFEEIYNSRKNIKEKPPIFRSKSMVPANINVNSIYGNIKFEYDEKARQYPNFFNDMEELNMILKKNEEKLINLESSKQTMYECKKNLMLKYDEIRKEAEDELKNKVYIKEDNAKKENENLFNMLLNDEQEKKLRKDSNIKSRKTTDTISQPDQIEENVMERKITASTLLKLPFIANKFLNSTNRRKSKNKSESTNFTIKTENDSIEPLEIRNKVSLNAIIEEKGFMSKLNYDDIEEDNCYVKKIEKNIYVDKKREYHERYSSLINRNHDENIEEIIGKIIVKQNLLTKKLSKTALKNNTASKKAKYKS